jgi:hypothetical protein
MAAIPARTAAAVAGALNPRGVRAPVLIIGIPGRKVATMHLHRIYRAIAIRLARALPVFVRKTAVALSLLTLWWQGSFECQTI